MINEEQSYKMILEFATKWQQLKAIFVLANCKEKLSNAYNCRWIRKQVNFSLVRKNGFAVRYFIFFVSAKFSIFTFLYQFI